MCVGQEGGAEAGIHGMREIFEDDDTVGLIQVDANNAFNTLNRVVLLHNIKYLCPEMETYVCNCYAKPARLFVTGGLEIPSAEGTTQGDPIAMPLYAICILPLMRQIVESVKEKGMEIKQCAFADDLAGAGKLLALKSWWNAVVYFGPFIGYYAKSSKSWLLVKTNYLDAAKLIFANSGLNITSEGRKHLGASIGSEAFKTQFVDEAVTEWVNEINKLSEIALMEPHAAYTAFIHGVRHKHTYMMRTIPNISGKLKVLDKAIDNFITFLLNKHSCSRTERILFSLPVKLGGLGIIIRSELSDIQYKNSVYITKSLTHNILNQNQKLEIDVNDVKRKKNKASIEKLKRNVSILEKLKNDLTTQQKRIIECTSEKGASSWLSALPLQKYDFYLDKQSFRDALFLRYDITLPKLPLNCVCGRSFNVNNAFLCLVPLVDL